MSANIKLRKTKKKILAHEVFLGIEQPKQHRSDSFGTVDVAFFSLI